jgi:hypothetical protein
MGEREKFEFNFNLTIDFAAVERPQRSQETYN